MNDREAIRQLRYEYCFRLDQNDIEGFVSLFTEEADFSITTAASGTGQDELREFMKRRQRREPAVSSHMPMNPVIEITGDSANSHWYYLVLITPSDGPTELGQGEYTETYRRVEDTWLIDSVDASRRHTVTFG